MSYIKCLLCVILLSTCFVGGCASQSDEKVSDWIPSEEIQSASREENELSVPENDISKVDVANQVLVIGNSITLGFGTHGMASSAVDTDYYYHLQCYMQEKNPDVQMKRIAGYGWESSITSEDRQAFLEQSIFPELEQGCDLVIIQLGDNVNTPEKKETFAADCENMLMWFRENAPEARVLWVFGRYNLDNAVSIKAACTKYDAEYVDISIVSTDDRYKAALGNEYEKDDGTIGVITDAGVASHPNDYAMTVISNLIIEQLGY